MLNRSALELIHGAINVVLFFDDEAKKIGIRGALKPISALRFFTPDATAAAAALASSELAARSANPESHRQQDRVYQFRDRTRPNACT